MINMSSGTNGFPYSNRKAVFIAYGSVMAIIAITLFLSWLFPFSDRIPQGRYSTIIILPDSSFQINMDQQDTDKGLPRVWIREDRNSMSYFPESHLVGVTAFSNFTIDCNTKYVGFNEQRVFEEDMKFQATTTGSGNLERVKSLSAIAALFKVCKLSIPEKQNREEQENDQPNDRGESI